MPSSGRLAWVDAARAFSIIAIILLHLSIWVLPPLYEAYPDMAIWRKVLSFTGAFRLPVLFALSGFLVADRVRAGWRDRRNLLRATTSYYLYVVWLVIYAVISVNMPGSQPVGVPWTDFIPQLVAPATPLWFVLFLAVHVSILTTLNRVHPAIVLGGAAIVSWLSIRVHLPPELAMVERGFYYLFFFALGVYGKQILIYFSRTEGMWWRVPATIATAFIAMDALKGASANKIGYLAVIFLRDVSAIFCIVAVMGALCLIPPVQRALGYVGQRTLPAYVMHVPLIWVLMAARDLYLPAMDNPVLRLSAPLLALLFVFVISLSFHALAMRFPIGRVLFDLPPIAKEAILGKARGPAGLVGRTTAG